MPRCVITIGVYEFDLPSFRDALDAHDAGLVIDVRQRRGVRGARYAWANARRLQAALAEAGIAYRHHRELAPTTELRQLQYAADDRAGVGKRSLAERYDVPVTHVRPARAPGAYQVAPATSSKRRPSGSSR